MGLLRKRAVIRAGRRSTLRLTIVDTGADQTVLRGEVACRLGLRPSRAPLASMGAMGGGRVVGYELPVRVRVGSRTASVVAFVPAYRNEGTLAAPRYVRIPARDQENLLGHDFLQESEASLRFFRQPKRPSLAGMPAFRSSRWKANVRPISPAERRFLRAQRICR